MLGKGSSNIATIRDKYYLEMWQQQQMAYAQKMAWTPFAPFSTTPLTGICTTPLTGTQIRIEEDLAKPPKLTQMTAAQAFAEMDKVIKAHEAIAREMKEKIDAVDVANKAILAAYDKETPFEKECRRADEMKRKVTSERATQYMVDEVNKKLVAPQAPEEESPIARAFRQTQQRTVRDGMLGLPQAGRDVL